MSNNDNTGDRLEQAVRDFRAIESMLHQLADQTQSVNGAGQRLETAQHDLHQLQEKLTESMQQHAGLARDLATATQAVRELDPSKIFGEIERLSTDVERQGDRISEMTGELRTRIEAHEKASEQRIASLDTRLWKPSIMAAAFSAVAVILLVISLAIQ